MLEARKAERSALAELGSTLHEAFQGGLDGLEKQLGGLVGAAVASEVAKIDTVLAGLQAEREANPNQAQQEARKAQRTADDAGISRHEGPLTCSYNYSWPRICFGDS